MKKLLAALAALTFVLSACDVGDMVLEPGTGTINDGPTVPVSGQIPSWVPLDGSLTVNGQPTAVQPDRTWSTTVPAEPGLVTDIEAIYTRGGGADPVRQRTAVVNGAHLDEGEMSPDGVGMRFTNAGLAGLGPVIQDLAGGAFDIGGLLLAQNPIIDEDNAFLTLDIVGNAFEAGIGGVSVDAASTTGGVSTEITIDDLYVGVNLNIRDGLLINLNCGLELQIPTTTIDAKFDLAPQAGSPSNVDVNLVGTPVVDTGNVSYEFISGVCDGDVFVIGDIVNAVAGPQIEALVGSGFATSLGDPDGAGPADSPIADAIETALAEISIAGPVGEAVGAQLNAPFTQITEGADAIDFRADADFATSIGTGPGQCVPPAGAPDLPSSFDVPGAYPALGATTPSGDPYGLGLVISASAFNQMLGSITECGLINRRITEISLGGPPVPVTSTVLSALVPELGTKLPPGTPMAIKVTPSYAPFLTEHPGPAGEPGELYLANLRVDFVQNISGIDWIWLSLGVDAPLGFDLGYDPVAGQLAPTLTPPPAAAVQARVLSNLIGTNEPFIQALFPSLFPVFAGDLSSSFGAFPLPAFLGLQLEVLDVQRIGNHFVLYANLDPVPHTRIENVQITDLSSADSVVDSILDVNEWRHRIRPKISSSGVSVDFKGVLGADACCFTGDESRSATAGYRVALSVVPENGDTWRLDVGQLLRGAHTIHNEDLGRGSSQFTTAVVGRARIGSGAWQDFSFTPSVTSASTGNGSGGTVNLAFTGADSTVLQGSTAAQVTIEFTFGLHASSDSDVFPPLGDEVAIRFGANDTITNGFTAVEYPGAGSCIVTDGHFATIALSTVE